MTKLVSFDYANKTITISHTVGNVIYIQVISWAEMELRVLRGLREH